MHAMHNRKEKSAGYNEYLKSFVCAALIIFITSCSADLTVQRETQYLEESAKETQYSLVFIIHGDNDYLYHDTSGNEYNADEVTVEKAKRIAEQNPNAEVFIFHQKPKPYFLFFFPQKDGEFYYYRNGELISNETYWRDQQQSSFENELEYYRRYHVNNKKDMVNILLYFGHEIPELGGEGYDASYPDRAFTIANFANGLKDLTSDSSKFDILILSTCYGGTPYTIGTLAEYSKYIIASPENLHLSYFDISLLERLNLSLNKSDTHTFAKRFAHHAFERLTSEIQTEVSVVVYDVDRVKNYYQSVYKNYENDLKTLRGDLQLFAAKVEHCDCEAIPTYALPAMKDGVDVYYRSARFGRAKTKQNHSGWECLKLIE